MSLPLEILNEQFRLFDESQTLVSTMADLQGEELTQAALTVKLNTAKSEALGWVFARLIDAPPLPLAYLQQYKPSHEDS